VKIYSGENIRNVALVGHGHAGKTTLASAMLYTAGAMPRLGRVDDGSATTDYDDEEIARKMSISVGAAVVEWGKSKINILDTPSTCLSTKPRWCCPWWTPPSWWSMAWRAWR
jgi:elongation factor G